MSHYLPRVASPQAWRRLRKTMTEGELRDISWDVTNILKADLPKTMGRLDDDEMHNLRSTIQFALSGRNWDAT